VSDTTSQRLQHLYMRLEAMANLVINSQNHQALSGNQERLQATISILHEAIMKVEKLLLETGLALPEDGEEEQEMLATLQPDLFDQEGDEDEHEAVSDVSRPIAIRRRIANRLSRLQLMIQMIEVHEINERFQQRSSSVSARRDDIRRRNPRLAHLRTPSEIDR
jgi:hypothetical protein